jgi:hypothetical protein
LSVGELAQARRAGLAFAASYLASTSSSDPLIVRAASGELADQLRANAARFSDAQRHGRVHLIGIRLDPRGARRIAATMALAEAREPSFSIGFVLELHAGQWLATRLDGN